MLSTLSDFAKITPFLAHTLACARTVDPEGTCDCGLDDLLVEMLDEIEAPLPTLDQLVKIVETTEPADMSTKGDNIWTNRMAEALHATLIQYVKKGQAHFLEQSRQAIELAAKSTDMLEQTQQELAEVRQELVETHNELMAAEASRRI